MSCTRVRAYDVRIEPAAGAVASGASGASGTGGTADAAERVPTFPVPVDDGVVLLHV